MTARVGANAGDIYKYTGKVKISDNTVYIMSKNSNFIYYLLLKYDLKRLSFGTGQPLIKTSELKKLQLSFPINNFEQQKIGSFFNSLDHLITLHQRKLENLEETKKGLLQNIFPKYTEVKPNIRFNNFYDDWTQKKLGELLQESIKTSPKYPENHELLKVKLHFKGIIASGEKPKPTKKGREYYFRNKGELIIGKQNFHNGGFGIVDDKTDGLIASSAILSFDFLEINPEFLINNMQRNDWLKLTEIYIGGTGQKEYSINTIKDLEILSTTNEQEQQKIGDLFSSLDYLITLHKSKLKALDVIKNSLLQKMFI